MCWQMVSVWKNSMDESGDVLLDFFILFYFFLFEKE